jgi:hypothetical protein
MKSFLLFAITVSLFGCSSKTISAQSLIGQWEAVSLNGSDLVDEGFEWVTISFSERNLEVKTHLHSKANLTTISRGTWELDGHHLTIDYGSGVIKEAQVDVESGYLVFTPDILLKDKAISRYRRILRDSAQQGLLR